MSEMLAQAKERNQIFQDIDEGKIPKRVPVYTWMDITYIMQYAGVDLKRAQWDVSGFRNMIEVGAKSFASDINPATFTRLYPVYKILGAKNFVMGSGGQIQHPEIIGMEPDEYDEMIKDPYKFMHDKVFPRLYTNLDTTPARKAMVFAKAQKAFLISWDT